MFRIEIRYKDEYSRGEWSYCSGEFNSLKECKEWFGLDECLEYEVLKIEKISK